MGERTGIEWTDATWNPIRGCTPVSDGCRNCYAAGVAYRFGQNLGDPYYGLADWRGGRAVFNGKIMRVPSALTIPMRWRKPRRIFVNSMSDLFHDDVPDEFIARVFAVAHFAPRHTFQILTKRPERAVEWFKRWDGSSIVAESMDDLLTEKHFHRDLSRMVRGFPWPLPNVWLGVSVENQAAADTRIPHLLECPAAVRFLSCEPLLRPVKLTDVYRIRAGAAVSYNALSGRNNNGFNPISPRKEGARIDWVIAGGESGPNARPMHPDWARSLRDQCEEAGVAFLFKQFGAYNERGELVGKKAAGRVLDGRVHDGYPTLQSQASPPHDNDKAHADHPGGPG